MARIGTAGEDVRMPMLLHSTLHNNSEIATIVICEGQVGGISGAIHCLAIQLNPMYEIGKNLQLQDLYDRMQRDPEAN